MVRSDLPSEWLRLLGPRPLPFGTDWPSFSLTPSIGMDIFYEWPPQSQRYRFHIVFEPLQSFVDLVF